jgi:predicted 2-oxoglutarate/Fe(II)-dependent dioxygenase YbiX
MWSTLGTPVPPERRVTHWIWTAFLSGDTCAAIRSAMDRGASDPAEILEDAIEHQDHVRRTLSIEVDVTTLAVVERAFEDARSRLAELSGMPLGAREGAGFLRYLPGGFYRPHRDRGDVPSWPGAAHRQLALVVFLNTARDGGDAEGFTGGVLRLYPDDSDPVDIVPAEGMLVAFPATVLHEVTRVGDAVRDAVVDWFY